MADSYNPFQSVMQPNSRQAGLWDLRMMSAANRMEAPFEHGARSSYGHGIAGDPLLSGLASNRGEPDYSQFTYNPAMHQAAIAAGVQPLEANQVKPNVLLPNTGFFGNHPALSGGLEGALFGLAASHGGATLGESLQGVAEGVIGGQQIRQGLQRQQFARPFEARAMLEGMQDRQQKRDLQDADIQHLRALNEHYKNGDDEKAAALENTQRHQEIMEGLGYQRLEATAPRNLGEGLYGYYNPGGSGPGQKGEWSIQENPQARNGQKPPHALVAIPDGKGGVTYREAAPGVHFNTTPETASQAGAAGPKADMARQNFVKKQMSTPGPIWMQAGISPGDKNAAQKLGQWYDQNITPPEAGGAAQGSSPDQAIVIH